MEKIALALLGILVGSLLQFRFGLLKSKSDKVLELKTTAYTDFLSSVSALAIAQKNIEEKKLSEATVALISAKSRICVYGSAKVIEKLADFWRGGAVLDSPERIVRYIKIVQAMRADGFQQEITNPSDLSQILVNLDIEERTKVEQDDGINSVTSLCDFTS